MSTETKPEIAPRMADGEPFCTPQCPRHGLNGGGCFEGVRYCPPALRFQRDDARRELCEMWSSEFGTHEHVADVREYAASRGWSYLYEEKKG